jgi:TM2 domain-containing membrane protein YozV
VNRDLRKYAKQTNIRLSIGFVLLLFIVGDGLIYLFYGLHAAITGLICLVGAGLPVILITGALWFIEWVGKHSNL